MKISLPLFTCVSAICLTLAACGGDDNDNDNDNDSSSSVSVSSSVASSSSSSAAGWALVWEDEFDGETIDSTKWSHEVNCTGGGNNELQCYTARAENSYVEDGKLHIVAKKETFSGPAKSDDDKGYDAADTSITREYTSARLRSKNKGDWKYGRIEFNAQLPQGQGIWPALWMLPTDFVYGGWPLSGEIDVMEAVNSNTPYPSSHPKAGEPNNTVNGTLHYGRIWPNNLYTGTEYIPENTIWETFNTYAVEWEEGEIRWYVNDEHFATQTSDGWFTYVWKGETIGYQIGEGAAPFDQKFHAIMNVAVGGNWPGSPNAETTFPQQMIVDYVRVYQCEKDPETGKGCATHVNPDIEPLPGHAAPEQQTFNLYDDGPGTFSFQVGGETVTNTLVPGAYDGGIPGNVVADAGFDTGDDIVWDLMFNASPGNAFLSTGDMSSVAGVDSGLKLTGMAASGEFQFDIKVDAIDPATKLLLKVDSGWPNVSETYLDIPPAGEWTHMAIRFSDLQPNHIQAGQVDYNKVLNPFVIEPEGGTAHIKLDNIQIKCLATCSIDPVLAGIVSVLDSSFDIYVDGDVGVNWDFGIGTWDNNTGHVVAGEAEDPDRGDVIDLQFDNSANNGLAFIQSTTAKNASAFATDGYLEFDIKVIDYGTNTSGLVVKAESGPSTGSGDYVIHPAVGSWETVQVLIADMLALPPEAAGPLNLAAFNTPFVILPVWGDQAGVHFQVDNVRWILPE